MKKLSGMGPPKKSIAVVSIVFVASMNFMRSNWDNAPKLFQYIGWGIVIVGVIAGMGVLLVEAYLYIKKRLKEEENEEKSRNKWIAIVIRGLKKIVDYIDDLVNSEDLEEKEEKKNKEG